MDSLDEAIRHINRYNTGHSEAIITCDYDHAQEFLNRIDAAAVYVNASTRFTDGGEFGLERDRHQHPEASRKRTNGLKSTDHDQIHHLWKRAGETIMKLYIIRHGETPWNAEERLQGQTDIPLNENGIRLAKITGEALKDVPFDFAISSPLKRARQTAELVLAGRQIPVLEDARIEELSFGSWEGLG